ncbi:MAG: LacI family DNA-binding transcriptional regulator [Candidatus Omnitrophota bacterium]|nr:LacI family transcriptional regulator [Candidatus Omnitrophota bacterium]
MVRTKKTPSTTRFSIKDVARASGVSISTVSRVINKFPSVKEKSQQKVLEVIKQLNYQPSLLAQRLATGKSNVISLIIPRYEGMFYSFYLLELIRGIGTLCQVLKLDLLLNITDSNNRINFNGLGGVIFADIIGNRIQLEEALVSGVPVIVINNCVTNFAVSYIAIDNIGGAENAVDYLVGLGHKNIVHISGDLNTQSALQRLEGYKRSLEKNRISFNEGYVLKTDYSRGQARIAAEKILKIPKRPTAVFVSSDSMALEVMTVVVEKGLKVPNDLSIIGYDDNPSGLYGPVALTTVRQPLVRMAEQAVKELKVLMDAKDKPKIKRMLLQTELIVRESCASVK